MAALRFFFKKTLKRHDPDFDDIGLARRPKKLPVVLSPEEVTQLLEAARNLRYRTILLALYSTGLRRTEVSRLKISDIDSQRMLIHVHQGKGSRDREVPLTPKLLEALREYWRAAKVKPKTYLFPSRTAHNREEKPISDKAVWIACQESALRAGLSKRIGPHTCGTASRRTCSNRVPICARSSCCWGMSDLKDTALYLHLSRRHLRAATNPLDQITLRELSEDPEPPENGQGDAATLGGGGHHPQGWPSIHRSQSGTLTWPQLKVLHAIAGCRTAALGGHRDRCDRCGYQAISYNSCRNRHCPKCQTNAREKWLSARQRELLPATYYHVVFSVPHQLVPLMWQNKKVLFKLLFEASAATLLEVARDPRHLGAEIGFLSVLHTWGQTLQCHPHVHCVVPGAACHRTINAGSDPRRVLPAGEGLEPGVSR